MSTGDRPVRPRRVRFGLLGPLAVETGDGEPVRVRETKVRALLAALLLADGRVVAVDRLVADVWPAAPPGDPANTVQTKISQLRRVLSGAGGPVVRYAPPGYRLEVGGDAVDLHRFRALTARAAATADPARRAERYGAALALWRGPALDDLAELPFAAAAAVRLGEERLDALEQRARARLDQGEHGAVALDLAPVVAEHPLREGLWTVQLRALYGAGRQAEALAGYDALRRRLADELGLDPAPELVELHRAMLGRDPGLRSPGQRTGHGREQARLPNPPTGLIGRAGAASAVSAALTSSRLVTLTGPGGVGKTRLALAVAATRPPGPDAEVRLVELAGVEAGAGAGVVAGAVAAALQLGPDPSRPDADPADRLAGALRDRELLVVLDNCEHVVDGAARLVAALLTGTGRVRVLATGRQPLGLRGETVWTVPPLTVPATGDAAAVRSSEAGRLLLARGAEADPDLRLTADNAAALATVCRRLDGLPLALELAATRLRTLEAGELAARLDDRFRLLDAGPRDLPARQRTLAAVLDWSWELLDEPARAVLRRFAAHAEAATLDSAEHVCARAPVPDGGVPRVLADLVDRSLVSVVPAAADGDPGPRRYRLLESVAEYARARLAESGEAEHTRARHARFHAGLAVRLEPAVRGPDQRRALGRLASAVPELRAAATLLAGTDPALAVRSALASAWPWFLLGRLDDARSALRSALAAGTAAAPDDALRAARTWLAGLDVLAGGPVTGGLGVAASATDGITDPVLRARAAWFAGHVLASVGGTAEAAGPLRLALGTAREAGETWVEAAALADLAGVAVAAGDLAAARTDATRAEVLFRGLGDRWGQLQTSFALGTLAEIAGDHRAATARHTEGLHRAQELQLWPEVSYQLSWLGRAALLDGAPERAREQHERALRVAVEHGFTPGEMYARTGLALGARRAGELDTARRELDTVLDWHRSAGGAGAESLVLVELGFVAELRGEPARAADLHREALAHARQAGDPRAVALALEGTAGAALAAGDPRRAARLLGAAAGLRDGVGAPLPPAERGDVARIERGVRDALGAAATDAAQADGRRAPEAVARAHDPQ